MSSPLLLVRACVRLVTGDVRAVVWTRTVSEVEESLRRAASDEYKRYTTLQSNLSGSATEIDSDGDGDGETTKVGLTEEGRADKGERRML